MLRRQYTAEQILMIFIAQRFRELIASFKIFKLATLLEITGNI